MNLDTSAASTLRRLVHSSLVSQVRQTPRPAAVRGSGLILTWEDCDTPMIVCDNLCKQFKGAPVSVPQIVHYHCQM
jgi:hypothetical protein